jgi:hypothetical protein
VSLSTSPTTPGSLRRKNSSTYLQRRRYRPNRAVRSLQAHQPPSPCSGEACPTDRSTAAPRWDTFDTSWEAMRRLSPAVPRRPTDISPSHRSASPAASRSSPELCQPCRMLLELVPSRVRARQLASAGCSRHAADTRTGAHAIRTAYPAKPTWPSAGCLGEDVQARGSTGKRHLPSQRRRRTPRQTAADAELHRDAERPEGVVRAL